MKSSTKVVETVTKNRGAKKKVARPKVAEQGRGGEDLIGKKAAGNSKLDGEEGLLEGC